MATRELTGAPRILPLYARAAAATFLPGAGRLPFLPGGGEAIPTNLELELADIAIDPGHLAAYAKVGRLSGPFLPVGRTPKVARSPPLVSPGLASAGAPETRPSSTPSSAVAAVARRMMTVLRQGVCGAGANPPRTG